MPKTYSAEPRSVKPAELPDAVLLSIGKLVRACAEMEDIVDLFIANLAEISETRATILLGRTAISRRLEIALDLAKIRDDKALEYHKKAFDAVFTDLLECRNVVAHGKLLGETEDGYAFLTANSGPVREDSKVRIVVSYSADTIHAYATAATERVPQLENLLQVAAPRAERLLRPLQPHSKAQSQGRSKQQPPPPPSRA